MDQILRVVSEFIDNRNTSVMEKVSRIFFSFYSYKLFQRPRASCICPSFENRPRHACKNVRRFKIKRKNSILSVFCMLPRFETCSRSTFAQVIGKFRLQRTETGRAIPVNLDKLAYILILWRSNCKGSFCRKKRVVSIPKNPFSIQEAISHRYALHIWKRNFKIRWLRHNRLLFRS